MQTLFNHICARLSLGSLTEEPVRLSGGYMHRMYALTTSQGRFAVKLLNPEIMQRPDALDNYRCAEDFENLLEEAGLPILPALTIEGSKLHRIDGQYLYVFPFYEGHVLSDAETTPVHCTSMGDVLARIHACAHRELSGEPELPDLIDWHALTNALLACPSTHAEGEAMHSALPMLTNVTKAAHNAAMRLPRRETLCHNDMDAKNVLWHGDDFRIIDLECLGWADPIQEMLDLAISWAGYELNEAKFKAFIHGYQAAGGETVTDPAAVFDSRRNHIDWLAYNVRRAMLEDPQEARIGREQIIETLEKLSYDQQHRETILRWMKEASAHA